MNHDTHPNWVPNSLMGSRQETAVLLVGTAREFDLVVRHHVASTAGGFYITDALADKVYEDEASEPEPSEPEQEPEAETPEKTAKRSTKTSGNRAAKNDSEEE